MTPESLSWLFVTSSIDETSFSKRCEFLKGSKVSLMEPRLAVENGFSDPQLTVCYFVQGVLQALKASRIPCR